MDNVKKIINQLKHKNMKKEEKNTQDPQFNTATNTSRKAGQEGAEKLREFMLSKYGKDPATMTRAEKKAFKKMAKELLEARQIDEEEYEKILAALK